MVERFALVVEDEGFLRMLIAGFLEQAGFSVRTAANAAEARRQLARFDPDVVVLDIDLGPGPSGLDIGEALLSRSNRTAVVYLTMLSDPRIVHPRASVNPRAAYLNKRLVGEPGVLLEAIEAVLRELNVRDYRDDQRPDAPLAKLSATQFEILRLIADGKTNQQIADLRGRSLSATEGTISRLFAALGIDPATQANARILAARTFLQSLPAHDAT